MPPLEWSLLLHVGEVVVPLEFGDSSNPLPAHGQEFEWTKRCGDCRAQSSRTSIGRRVVSGPEGRRDQLEAVDPSLCLGRHEPRQILGVREERENSGDREGNPVGKLQLPCHARSSKACLSSPNPRFAQWSARLAPSASKI